MGVEGEQLLYIFFPFEPFSFEYFHVNIVFASRILKNNKYYFIFCGGMCSVALCGVETMLQVFEQKTWLFYLILEIEILGENLVGQCHTIQEGKGIIAFFFQFVFHFLSQKYLFINM